MMKKIGLRSGILILMLLGQAQAATYYVATTGSNNNSGASGTPFATILKCWTTMVPGDTCLVRAGTYGPVITTTPLLCTAAQPCAFRPESPSPRPIIDRFYNNQAAGDVHVFQIGYGATYVTLEGFELTDTNPSIPADTACHIRYGFDLWKWQNDLGWVTLRNNLIHHIPGDGILTHMGTHDLILEDNEIYDTGYALSGHRVEGMGMYVVGPRNVIRRNKTHDNNSNGIRIGNSSTGDAADDAIVEGNSTWNTYGPVYWPQGSPATCVLQGDGSGIVSWYGDRGTFRNNTVDGVQKGWGIRVLGNNAKVLNNSVQGAEYQGVYFYDDRTGNEAKNNIIYQSGTTSPYTGALFINSPNAQSSNLLGINPLFVNASAHDLHLQANSPATDTGVTLALVPTDLDGVVRPLGAAYDIGAYEFISYPPNPPTTFTLSHSEQ